MKNLAKTLLVVVLGALLFAAGRWSAPKEAPETAPPSAADEAAAEPEVWTCPMHAQIRLPEPVPCPICGMDLVLLESGEDPGPRRMAMSPDAVRLAGIRTTPVARRYVTRPVRMTGKLDYDETAVQRIAAWVPGRIERMFVDYTGVGVAEGEHLFELYSPDLLTAQEELLTAKERLKDTADEASELLRASTARGVEAAREKLRLLGLSAEQVAAIEERGAGVDLLTIPSPATGTVIHKALDEGAYVQTGTPVYTIADLRRLWVRLDAYEQDLTWLRFGQRVTLQAEALPGETFEGTISFIDPVVHDLHRTTKVRVNVPNPDARLKPGMFVRAVVEARLGRSGAIVPPDLAGKWVSPMHPEIVKDGPGECDVCGMPLVPAEELTFTRGDATPEKALVVPESAVLATGTRAVVYVEVPGTEKPTYEGREVLLGPRAGDEYVIRGGLEEGERVVIQGAFRIDSSMQIQAKRSMLSMPAESPASGPEGAPFRASLAPLYQGYLALGAALADDDPAAARTAAAELGAAMDAAQPELLPRAALIRWGEERHALRAAIEDAAAAEDLDALRAAFEPLSRAVLAVTSTFGVPEEDVWYEAYCPMAFDGRGASWLQATAEIANPYFGAAMLRCGEIRTTFAGTRADLEPDDAPDVEPDDDPDDEHAGHAHEAPVEEGPDTALFRAYLAVQAALAADRMAGADEIAALEEAASSSETLESQVAALREAADIAAQRAAFWPLSQALLARLEAGNHTGMTLHEVHCPMAFDFEGASWISDEAEVRNPYFGDEMPTCGAVKRAFEPRR